MSAGEGLVGGEADEEPHVFAALFDEAESELRVNGEAVAEGEAGTFPLGGVTLGASFNDANFLKGDIAAVLVFNRRLPATQIEDVEAYLQDKYFGAGTGTLQAPSYAPVGKEGDAGEGTGAVAVSEPAEGLASGTTYRYRAVAESEGGTSYGAKETLATAPHYASSFGEAGSEPGQLSEPRGLTLDSEGDIWVADTGNDRIEEFDAEGEFVQEFGSLGAGDGQLDHPSALALDSEGDIWVADTGNNRIEEFSPEGEYLAQFGETGTGEAQLSGPRGLALDSAGNVWIADTGNDRVQQWGTAAHRVFDEALYQGTLGREGSEAGQLQAPSDVALDAEGHPWVTSRLNDRIEQFSPEGEYLSQFGESGSGNGQLDHPASLAFDPSGDIWVSDHGNNRVEKFDSGGQYVAQFGSYGSSNGQLDGPEGIAVNAVGDVWVTDASRVQEFGPKGEFIRRLGSEGSAEGQISEPGGIDIGPGGDIWVADCGNNRVSVFAPDGSFIRQFGSAGSAAGQFLCPYAIDIDEEGHVWVGDTENDRVELFDEAGEYVMQFGESGSGEGQFSLNHPMGIASDENGQLWIADPDNDRVQEWVAGHAAESEEEVPTEDGPSVEVETQGGLVASVTGEEAGTHSYTHEGQELTAYSGPEGETGYEYDEDERLTKVTLPNGTWGEIAYFEDGRVESVTVSIEEGEAKKTTFSYQDKPERRTTVIPPDAPHVIYDIGEDGSVFKWWNVQKPPTIDYIAGTLGDVEFRETADPINPGEHRLTVQAHSEEGIASIQVIVNNTDLVDEQTCDAEENLEECLTVVDEWVMETETFAPGRLYIEVLITDRLGESTSERYWVNIPQPPPPPAPGTPIPPKFKDIAKFREEYGLEKVFPVRNEIELDERIFNLIKAWHEPDTPEGEVARATMDRWGVPLRPADVAELEYRDRYVSENSEAIAEWGEQHHAEAFAGTYLDHPAGGILHVGFTEDPDARLAELEESVSLVAVDRLAPFPSVPKSSLVSLGSAFEDVMDAIESDEQLASLVKEVSVDEAANVVRVGGSDVSAIEGIITSLMGPEAPVSVFYEPTAVPVASGRNRTTGRMRAGDKIIQIEVEACTAAFGGFEDRQQKQTGEPIRARFILSAGHCFDQDAPVSRSTQGALKAGENDAISEIGVVRRNAYHPIYGTDGLAIRAKSGYLVPHKIFGSTGNPVPYGSATKAQDGNDLCYSGATLNGVSCGPVIGRGEVILEDPSKPSGSRLTVVGAYKVNFRKPIQLGDSGSPVWNPRTGAAVGVVSGRRPGEHWSVVSPLLHPKGLSVSRVPGILHAPEMYSMHLITSR